MPGRDRGKEMSDSILVYLLTPTQGAKRVGRDSRKMRGAYLFFKRLFL